MKKSFFVLIFSYFLLVCSSPILVLIDKDIFVESGWLAIGGYKFDFFDGIFRSSMFAITTVPLIMAFYYSKPSLHHLKSNGLFGSNKNIYKDRILYHIGFYALCALYFVLFAYNLGINGVEVETEYRLSGLAYYFRSYIALLLVTIYIYKVYNPSLLLIFIYSLVSGFTSASRFVAIVPLIILWGKLYFSSPTGFFNRRSTLLLVGIFLMFTFITNIRIVFYLDDFVSSDFLNLLMENFNNDYFEIMRQGLSQLILRVGLGRDVILSYEIAEKGTCDNYIGLFFGAGSCFNPPLDFYGLDLDSNKFYLAPPQMSSLFISSDNTLVRMLISAAYAIMIFLISKLFWRIMSGHIGVYFVPFVYIFILIFSVIGPILYLWYMLLFCFVFSIFEFVFLKKLALKLKS